MLNAGVFALEAGVSSSGEKQRVSALEKVVFALEPGVWLLRPGIETKGVTTVALSTPDAKCSPRRRAEYAADTGL